MPGTEDDSQFVEKDPTGRYVRVCNAALDSTAYSIELLHSIGLV